MILELMAAASVTAAQPAPAAPANGNAPTVAPLTVSPAPPGAPPAATINVPHDSNALGQWASVWPTGAYEGRVSGHVVLSCDIDRYGLAEWCKVAAETPAGHGFGAAALELRPTFKLTPPTAPDGSPAERVLNIAVDFKAPDPQVDWGGNRAGGPMGERAGATNPTGAGRSSEFSDVTTFDGAALVARPISMLDNPVWTSTASYDDVVRAYPSHGHGAEGYAVAHCQVSRSGVLSQCQPIKEDPADHGFGAAAVRLAARFRVSPDWATAPGHASLWVDVPIRFPAPGAQDSRAVTSPYWVAGFDPDQSLKLFPPEAAAQGLATGYGVAKCVVALDGTLTDCAPQEADPNGLGFSEAAARLASTMRMNPWTADGAPVDGTVVRVGFRLNLRQTP